MPEHRPVTGPVLVVFARRAGHAEVEPLEAACVAAFGADVLRWFEVAPSEDLAPRLDAALDALLAEGGGRVIAAGGDGTVSLVAGRLAVSRARRALQLGIVPLGTANVLAQELGIPLDLDEAVRVAAESAHERVIDGIRVGERCFLTQLGVGLDALMIDGTTREAQLAHGRLAYLAALARCIVGHGTNRFSLVMDGRPIRLVARQLVVANAGTLGAPPLTWGPGILPDDGVLNLCAYDVASVWHWPRLLWRALVGSHKRDERVRFLRFRRKLEIRTRSAWPVQGDGELLGRTPLVVRVAPGLIRMVVPPPVAPAEAPAAAAPPRSVHLAGRAWRRLHDADSGMYHFFNRHPGHRVLDRIMIAASSLVDHGEIWLVASLALGIAHPAQGWRIAAATMPPLWLAMLAVNYPIKALFRRHRPFVTHEQARVIGRRPSDTSFPSGHSAGAIAGALLLAPHAPALSPVFFAYALLVGASRVYLGVHYPGDVLIGWGIGALLAVAFGAARAALPALG